MKRALNFPKNTCRARHSPWPKKIALLGLLGLVLALAPAPLDAAATLTQQIDPTEANVGDQVVVTFTVQGGSDASIDFPHVDGLPVEGTSSTTQITFSNGTLMSAASQAFTLIPQRAGDFTIPAFDIRTRDGEVLHARAMKLHVADAGAPATTTSPAPAPQPNGPVVMPPAVTGDTNAPPGSSASSPSAPDVQTPIDPDGRPAKVFMVITAKTTDAYVGETIPVRIEFYIRMDSIYRQDSLPTIQGSDFLMNDLSVRPAEDEVSLVNEPYHRETWVTAISAPRSGDFPLLMTRDTYWTKNSQNLFSDPLGNFFNGRTNLAHANIPSNKLVIHSKPLPQEGRPADFTGAIGEFKATGNAAPSTVNIGEPAYLDFSVEGEGNFDSVRCPVLASDPAWKSYAATSQVHYVDESHIEGEKAFHQAIIPRKNGQLPLPPATFSYFDPTANKYVTISIPLPQLTVVGTPIVEAPDATPTESSSKPATPVAAPGFAGNRLEFGDLTPTLSPAYHQPWFWLSQAALLFLALLAALGLALRARCAPDHSVTESHNLKRSMHDLEDAMNVAVSADDAPSFFLAARSAVQLRWSAPLGLSPDSVTLSALAAHDPNLAETVAQLFKLADEILYSGQTATTHDLPQWQRRVHEEMLQAQPA